MTKRFSFFLSSCWLSALLSFRSHMWLRHSEAVGRSSFSLTRSTAMKSFASSEIFSKLSSSKSYSALVTLAMVSSSLLPIKGESPESRT
uniref:Secreted protein n=1 Tax=Ixodes ricinus TaxID=34613 RepID=A0A6B0U9V5_IXORI